MTFFFKGFFSSKFCVFESNLRSTDDFAPAPAAPAPAKESSWSSGLQWASTMTAMQGLAQNIQSCYYNSSSSSYSSSCSGTQITSSFLGVASQAWIHLVT